MVAILSLGRVRAGDAWTEFPLFTTVVCSVVDDLIVGGTDAPH